MLDCGSCHDYPPSGTVTFLFTDIEGSTRLWQAQPEAMRRCLARHDLLLRDAVERYGGYVFKTVGDAFYATFPTAPQGLEAAVAAQRSLASEPWPPACPIRVRMALHTGIAEERGGDYYGTTLNRVARLMGTGHGGQVLVSAPTQELVRDFVPEGSELRDLGEHRLKDLIRPERVYQLAIHGLPSEFPPLKSLESRPNNLPLQPTPFIGREREIGAVGELLGRPGVRLLTLTGAGGTGKTRLALQAAADAIDAFGDGVFFVDLSPLADASLVPSAIAGGLGVAEAPGQPLADTLKAYMADKRLLLVLDNFEQVLGAAPLVPRFLASSPGLKVLVTSRAALRVRGEQEYAVPTLAVPDLKNLPGLDALSGYDSIRLFVERAQNVKPDFAVTSENAPAIAEICYRLDGLPLAIELAAARVRMFPPQSLLSRLTSRLRLLTGGARDLPQRQQTLRGAIDWSYELLDAEEKALFARLAVFVGGRSFEAIEAVCNPEGDLDVLGGVESLIEKSLLRQEEGVGGEPRFVMLETIHEYARERLEQCGQGEELAGRHAGYYLALAEEAEPAELEGGPGWVEWLDRLEEEHDNFRAALGWSLDRGEAGTGLRLAGALSPLWFLRGHLTEGSRWLEEVLRAGDGAPAAFRAKALLGAGGVASWRGEWESARTFLEESLSLYRSLGDKTGAMRALINLGISVYNVGDHEQARAYYEEGLELARELGDRRGEPVVLNNLGEMARAEGDYRRAAALYEECLLLSREAGDDRVASMATVNLALIAIHEADYGRATALLREALELGRAIRNPVIVGFWLDALAGVAAARGHLARAATLQGAAEALLESTGGRVEPGDRAEYEAHLLSAREAAGRAAWEDARARGRAMGQEEAVEYALWDADEG